VAAKALHKPPHILIQSSEVINNFHTSCRYRLCNLQIRLLPASWGVSMWIASFIGMIDSRASRLEIQGVDRGRTGPIRSVRLLCCLTHPTVLLKKAIVLPLIVALPIFAFGQGQEHKKTIAPTVLVTVGRPNIWTMKQAHYLLPFLPIFEIEKPLKQKTFS
jgi:hypothetical protein